MSDYASELAAKWDDKFYDDNDELTSCEAIEGAVREALAKAAKVVAQLACCPGECHCFDNGCDDAKAAFEDIRGLGAKS